MNTPPPWLGISTGDWLINSNTPHSPQKSNATKNKSASSPNHPDDEPFRPTPRVHEPELAGQAFDNALAETTIGLYKTEAVRDDSPFRRGPLHRLTDVELLTAEWVHWYNTDRLMHRLGRIPPLEYETVHYATNTAHSEALHQ